MPSQQYRQARVQSQGHEAYEAHLYQVPFRYQKQELEPSVTSLNKF
jgi:hypothetical protein